VNNEVIFDGVCSDNEDQIADKFNMYFIDSINQIHNSIESVPYITNIINPTNDNFKFKFRIINMQELIEYVKKNGQINNVNIKVIRDAFEYVGECFLEIINESLLISQFPKTWKTATVIPIPKVQNTMKCDEFRPINMLPAYEKILGNVVKDQFMTYLSKRSILIKE
jgi:hypothetical protein